MDGPHYINAYCIIEQNQVRKNGSTLFENRDAAVPVFLESAYQYLDINYPKFYKMDLLSKLGFLGSEVLLRDSFEKDAYQEQDTAVVLSNASGSLDTDIRYFNTVRDFASPSLFVYTLPNIMIGEICIRNQFRGENAFFVFPSFDATFTVDYVNDLIGSNRAKACICGWVELLNEKYQAFLFLVEKKALGAPLVFSAANIQNILPPGT